MKRLACALALCAFSAAADVVLGPGVVATSVFIPVSGGGGGTAWADTFTRADNSDMAAGCSSEGPGGDCGWVEVKGDFSIASNQATQTGETSQLVADAGGANTTQAQYAACRIINSGNYPGVVVRATGGGGSGDEFYVFRIENDDDYLLRNCASGASCEDLYLIQAPETWPSPADGDSIGISTDAGSGDSVVFTVYRWTNSVPDANFADWATGADTLATICASGCDFTWTNAPSAETHGPADGDRSGFYHGNTTGITVDNCMGGDVP